MNLVCAALIPDNRESEEMMRETWKAIRKALHLLLTRYKRCPIHGELFVFLSCIFTDLYSYTAIPAQTGKHKQYFTNKQNYYPFKNLLVQSRNCAFEDIFPKVQTKLIQYLTSLDEHHSRIRVPND